MVANMFLQLSAPLPMNHPKIEVIYSSIISGFLPNAQYNPGRMLAKSAPYYRVVINVTPLGMLSKKTKPCSFFSGSDILSLLKEEKKQAWNFPRSLYKDQIRPSGNKSGSLTGPDFAILTLEDPIPNIPPWLSSVPDILPNVLHECSIYGYSSFLLILMGKIRFF